MKYGYATPYNKIDLLMTWNTQGLINFNFLTLNSIYIFAIQHVLKISKSIQTRKIGSIL